MTLTAPTDTTPHAARRCLSVEASAEYLGICPRTLDNWRSQRRGPRYVAVGRRRVYRISDLEEYLEAHTVEVTAR